MTNQNLDSKNSKKAGNNDDDLTTQMKRVGVPKLKWKSLPSRQYSSPAKTPEEAMDRVTKGVEFFAFGQREESTVRQEALRDIQTKLNKVLCNDCKAVQVTGVFDKDTRALVCLFQKRYNLGRSPDGIVGRVTLRRLNAEYSKLSATVGGTPTPGNNQIPTAPDSMRDTPQKPLSTDTLSSAKLPAVLTVHTTTAVPTANTTTAELTTATAFATPAFSPPASTTPSQPKQTNIPKASKKQVESVLKDLEEMSQTLEKREKGADDAIKQLRAEYANLVTQNNEKGWVESLADRATGRDKLHEVRAQTLHNAIDDVSKRSSNLAVAKSLIDDYREKARTNSLSSSDLNYAQNELKQAQEFAQSPSVDPAIFKRGQEEAEKLYPGIEERDAIAPYAIVGGITVGVAAGWYAAGAKAVMLTSSLIRSCQKPQTSGPSAEASPTENVPEWKNMDSQRPLSKNISGEIPPENRVNPFSDPSKPPPPPAQETGPSKPSQFEGFTAEQVRALDEMIAKNSGQPEVKPHNNGKVAPVGEFFPQMFRY